MALATTSLPLTLAAMTGASGGGGTADRGCDLLERGRW